jgi:hypothetical protein
MSDSVTRARAQLDAWREQRADRLDRVRFHFIEALEKRASGQTGEARRLLDERLSSLLDAYARDLERATSESATPMERPVRGPLGALVEEIARHAEARGGHAESRDAHAQAAALPALAALDEFRQIWAQVRTQSQVRQSQEQAPANAGPLNSSALVHRSIALMRELSPGYLQQFLAYIDDLSWMEQLGAGHFPTGRETPQATGARKRSRGKAGNREQR